MIDTVESITAKLCSFARAYHSNYAKHKIFELDHPDTQRYKLERIRALEWNIGENVRYVPIDFEKDNMENVLEYAGFSRNIPSFFAILGFTYYLELPVFEKTITPDVKAILIETPANPLLAVTDISAISAIAKKHGILLIVDNTFMTPYLQRPIELGADIVIHSATKYIGGHSDVVAGLVVVNNKELAEKIAFIQNSTGGVLAPFDSFLLIRGLKTLAVRTDRHTENAADIAVFLQNNNAIKKFTIPVCPTHRDMSLVDKVIKINDTEAFENSRELAKKEGIFAGSSSGAALAAAKKLINSGGTGNIVIILPDRGDRYFTKGLYDLSN